MKYRYTFDFVETEEQAISRAKYYNATASRYVRKRYPAHYTPWSSSDGTEHLFVVWYVYGR